MSRHFDFVVIGGGSAGHAAASTARRWKERVAIIDDADELGGLCILRGCMPSKTVIHSAEVLHHARHAATFGLTIPDARVNMPALRERKRAMVREFQDYRVAQLTSGRYTLIRERAEFAAPDRVRLASGEEVTADYFLVATGSIPNWPAIPGLSEAGAMTSDDVLELSELPSSTIVLGGGVVACELAQYLHRLGSQVTLVQRSPRILSENSELAARTITDAFRAEGMRVFTDTKLTGIGQHGGEYVVTFACHGRDEEIRAGALVNALGRRPNTAFLNLEAGGVRTDRQGKVVTDAHGRTSNPRVFAAGDVAGPLEVVHAAVLQGETVGRVVGGQEPAPLNYDHKTMVIFTDPQLAFVGLTPEEMAARNLEVVEATYPFGDHGKSIVMSATAGYVRAWAEKGSGRLLAAECVGPQGGELIHALAVAITLGATAEATLRTQWYHPTLSEIWSYPLEELVMLAAPA